MEKNNMEEKWIRWEPVIGLAKRYDIEAISMGMQGLKILFYDDREKKNKVIMKFNHTPDSFRVTDETMRAKLIYDLDKKYGTDFYGDWSFFKVENSEYLEWLEETSGGILDSKEYIHFSIICSEFVLDIAERWEPDFEIIEFTKEN